MICIKPTVAAITKYHEVGHTTNENLVHTILPVRVWQPVTTEVVLAGSQACVRLCPHLVGGPGLSLRSFVKASRGPSSYLNPFAECDHHTEYHHLASIDFAL